MLVWQYAPQRVPLRPFMLQLVIDIGNTRTKLGLFKGRVLQERHRWSEWRMEDLVGYGRQMGAERVMVSSVATPDPTLLGQLSKHFTAFELSHLTPLPFTNAYQTPNTLGKDRLAAVAGAQTLFPGTACAVIDCGTCIKYEWLTADGVYEGGNIAPGAKMRLQAMHHFTARLPEAPMQLPDAVVGYSTESALQIGALYGAVLEMTGFIRTIYAVAEKKSSKADTKVLLQTILTGGDAPFFLPHLQTLLEDQAQNKGAFRLIEEPDLTLYGLNHILLNL